MLYNVASCLLYLKEYINDARSHEHKILVKTHKSVISACRYNCSKLRPSLEEEQDFKKKC
jgi:hypothetical protein